MRVSGVFSALPLAVRWREAMVRGVVRPVGDWEVWDLPGPGERVRRACEGQWTQWFLDKKTFLY